MMLDDLPAFLTVTQAAGALQLGRSKVYELTTLYERTAGAEGLPFVRFGCQKRVPRAALVAFIEQVLPTRREAAATRAGATDPTTAAGTGPGAQRPVA